MSESAMATIKFAIIGAETGLVIYARSGVARNIAGHLGVSCDGVGIGSDCWSLVGIGALPKKSGWSIRPGRLDQFDEVGAVHA